MKILIFLSMFTGLSLFAGDDAATLFNAKCAACHGINGRAETPMGRKQQMPSFAAPQVQKCTNAEIEDFILNGGKQKKPSHAFAGKGLTEADAHKLSVYIKELGKKK